MYTYKLGNKHKVSNLATSKQKNSRYVSVSKCIDTSIYAEEDTLQLLAKEKT